MTQKLLLRIIVTCVVIGLFNCFQQNIYSQATVSEAHHTGLDIGDLGPGASTRNLANTGWEWVRWATVSIIESERNVSRMKAGSASEISGDPGSNWQAGLFVGSTWTPGGYAGKSGVQFRGVESPTATAKQYTPKFQGTVEFFRPGGGGGPKMYTWDVKAHYITEDKRINKIIVLAHVTKGTFTTVGLHQTGERNIMVHQQEAIQRTTDWVWDIVKNYSGTLLDAVNQYLQSRNLGLVTKANYSTQFFPAVAGYGSMMLAYYDLVIGVNTSITSYSVAQTKSRVFVEIKRVNGENSTKTLDLSLNASELMNFSDNPLSLQAADAEARNGQRKAVIERWHAKVFAEIKANDGKIIKDEFGDEVTEDLTIDFNF